MINLQAAFGSEGTGRVVFCCHASSYSGLAFQKGTTANFYAGDALWRSVWLCRLDLKPKCHGSYPVRGCQIVDERNVYAFWSPKCEGHFEPFDGEARGAEAQRCRWFVERRGLPLPLLDQTLPFAPFGWVPGWAVRASRDRMDHFASTLTQTDRNLQLQRFI